MASNSNGDAPVPPSAAAAAPEETGDAAVARKMQTVEQLKEIFGFDASVSSKAVDAVGADVTACYNYILDAGMGADKGGPVTPIDNCPHVHDHVKLRVDQLPLQPHEAPCTHHHDAAATASSTVARPKADVAGDGSCPEGENWLCLDCGVIRCSRYVNGHGLVHWQETRKDDPAGVGHCIAASLADLSVWCHICGAYLRHPEIEPLTKMLEQLKFDDVPDRKKRTRSDAAESVSDTSPQESDEAPGGATSEDDHEDDEDVDGEEEEEEELYEMIAATAAARGIPLEFLVDRIDRENEPVVYPFDSLPSSLEEVSKFILSEKCQKIVVLAGAGMSVAAGIPDFRSANGLYATMNPDLLTANVDDREAIRSDPTFALDQTLFTKNPLPCLELNREFILGTRDQRWKATLAHRFVELLHAKTGKLARLYTQNIDGLEDQCTQLPRDKVIAVHGSMDRAECAMCKTESDFGEFCEHMERQIKDLSSKDPTAPKTSTPIACDLCGAQSMKPAIVLFKSSLPMEFFDNVPDDVQDVDLLIVVGTSLRVAPANSLVWRVPKSAMRLLVNREEVGWHLGMNFRDSERDYFAEGSCDGVFLKLMGHLGWIDDLAPLLPERKLPQSSADLLQEHLTQQKNGSIGGAKADT